MSAKLKKNDTAAYATQSAAKAAKLKPTSIQPVTVPEYKLGPKGTNKDKSPLSIKTIREKLSASSTSTAMDFAKSLAPKSGIPNVSRAKIKELFNPGAFEGMSGTIFEVALSGVLSDAQFDDYASRTSTSRIDLPYDKKLFDLFGTKGAGTLGAEVKANSTLAKAASIKFYDVLFGGGVTADYKKTVPVYDKDGKQIGTQDTKLGAQVRQSEIGNRMAGIVGPNGKQVGFQALQKMLGGRVTVGGLRNLRTQQGLPNFAGGYMPNFAGGLQDAIGREKAAGLPINQIRVNQDPKLRNSGNPMGLAVTNTRDEPTGAIPNFARGSKGSAGNDGGGMSGDFLTKMFAVQIGMSALSGVLGEVTEKNKLVSGSLTALNVAVSAMMAGQAFGGMKGVMGILGGAKGRAMQFGGRKANLKLAGTAGNILPKTLNSLKILGGGLLRLAGPLGAVTAVGLGLNKMLNNLNGTTANLENNQILLASAAKNAARELSELKIEDKEKFKEENVDITNFFKSRIGKLEFEGTEDKEQKASTVKLINEALDAGATQKAVEKIIAGMEASAASVGGIADEYGTSSEEMVMNDVAKRVNEALEGLASIDYSGIQDKFIAGITETQKLALAGKLTPEENEKGKQEVIDRARGTTPRPKGFIGPMPPAVENLTLAALQGALKEGGKAGGDVSKNIDKIKVDTAKTQLSMEIELMKLRAKALTFDEKTLILAKRNNSLSQVGIVKLQHKIALSKEDVTINSSLADVIQSQVNKEGSGIVLDRTEITAVAEAFSKANLDDLGNVEKRDALLEQTLKTLGKSENSIEASKGLMDATVLKIIQEGNQRKLNLGYTQKQALLDAQRAAIISNMTRDLTRQGRSRDIQTDFGIGSRKNALQLQRGLSDANPNLSDEEKARRNVGFTAAEGVLNIDESKANAVKDTRVELTNLIDKIPALGESLKILIGTLDKEGFGSLDRVSSALSFAKDSGLIKLSPKQEDALANTNVGIEGQKKNVELTGQQADVNNALSEAALKNINAFKAYSVLLSEFTLSLNQSAEQLKLDFLMVKDGAGAISNIDQQLFTAAAKVGGAGATARASDNQALRGATDRITLARTSVERRAAIKNRDILAKELELKTEIAIKQEDGITKEKDLVGLRSQLVELEKQRLAIGTSRAELFENEFNFTAEEIQEGLDRALVQNARTFVDTISDGLVDAIAKGQDLGDVLKQAASNFFLGEAKSNMSAAFKNITGNFFASGGPVTGGSGSKDDVPALLMGGEFVMKKSAVQKYGSGFMNSLNSGTIPAMARGGLFTPGTYGQGAMKGSRNLLDFATQSFTTGAFDRFGSGSGFASIGLEPQSAALTMFGRRNSPAFQREQASKQKAFGLFTRQMEKEKAAREKGSGFSEILKNSLLSFGASFGFKKLTDVFGPKVDISKVGKGLDMPKTIRYADERPYATGGYVPNAAGVDTIPSMLSGGEFVMNAAATQKIGRGNLNALNSGSGGGSGDVVGKLDELISVSDNSGETVINITVNSDGSSNSQGNGDDQQNSLATKIKDVVKQVIDDEKRLGGSLRQARA